ncbi:Hypothetical predicted protein [Cloeon dipterum]|uniref:E3 ubiquitin-protein ligase n=1 Tax=Cloeon dipterum TaxID=197152 RepID=A0A8S1DCM0_9INSE|nr:Hypothetical predicted protein [Cloeon dipterum]
MALPFIASTFAYHVAGPTQQLLCLSDPTVRYPINCLVDIIEATAKMSSMRTGTSDWVSRDESLSPEDRNRIEALFDQIYNASRAAWVLGTDIEYQLWHQNINRELSGRPPLTEEEIMAARNRIQEEIIAYGGSPHELVFLDEEIEITSDPGLEKILTDDERDLEEPEAKRLCQDNLDTNKIDKEECAICLMPSELPVRMPCSHEFCFTCAKGLMKGQKRSCALCRKPIPLNFFTNPETFSTGPVEAPKWASTLGSTKVDVADQAKECQDKKKWGEEGKRIKVALLTTWCHYPYFTFSGCHLMALPFIASTFAFHECGGVAGPTQLMLCSSNPTKQLNNRENAVDVHERCL